MDGADGDAVAVGGAGGALGADPAERGADGFVVEGDAAEVALAVAAGAFGDGDGGDARGELAKLVAQGIEADEGGDGAGRAWDRPGAGRSPRVRARRGARGGGDRL